MLKALQNFFQNTTAAEQASLNKADGMSDNAFLSLVLMTEISLADGKLSDEERQHLLYELEHEYDIKGEQAESAIKKAVKTVKEAASLYEFTAQLKALVYEKRVELLESLWVVAYADGELDPYEESMLRKLADLLYISHADYIKTKLKVMDS
ncbi:putative tellurite resistance protein B-like protein [Idiomarina loihiensis]|uniref:tellurite resistance TerB family protein n=1 Tax=Idiomarina TaxID=135575 RepID=UPI000D7144DE|nr:MULTISPECIES: TerB family tellurite resistance protein [Idiomarina]PWW36918.1 putative tellurite resistance protein B-like protein [Idiomarina loihiensis]TDP46726.1 putative tellurite resistance protein B-like protein [Idiomarina loihiensis]TDS22997.1 putative tellurite resistance protein B-like protein [Idiomarina sp. H2]